ncbi:MAG: MerR family DNA-binding transcriptional regulator [Candidatus Caenarcaniphilales bacterium]|nr:MerR family DNA-binding transcriptional regulator [Candidatus Caenarcaniphilales bacterium]
MVNSSFISSESNNLQSFPITIGELSELTGITKPTLRYYEKISLIASSSRTEGNYRLFEKEITLKKLDFIKKAQSLNFTLEEIKSLLDLSYPSTPCNEARNLLEKKITIVEQEIKALQSKRDFMHAIKSKWELIPDCSSHNVDDSPHPICELIDKI